MIRNRKQTRAVKGFAILLTFMMMATLLAGCAKDNKTILTVGDEKVSYALANFYVRNNQSFYETYYGQYYGQTDMASFWEGDSGSTDDDGNSLTMEESMKDGIKEDLENSIVLRQHMEEYGVSLTESDQASITEAASAFLAANSEEALEEVSATQEVVEEYLALQTISSRMYDAMIADVDTEVTTEEAWQKGISYVTFAYDAEVASDLSDASDPAQELVEQLSMTTADTAEAMAQEFYEGAVAAEDFAAYAESMGYTATDTTIGADSEVPSAEIAAAAYALSPGETTEIMKDETSSAFYIVRQTSDFDEEATESAKSTIAAQRQSDTYTERLEEMKASNTIKWNDSLWNKISLVKVGVAMYIPSEEETTEEDTEDIQEVETTSLNKDSSLEVQDGDTINLDYVGTIDGVEFEGGNTQGAGADLTIGSGTYIDNFEEQLIGSHPGDTVEVVVTFPEDYQATELAGQEAVFTCTVNGIYQ